MATLEMLVQSWQSLDTLPGSLIIDGSPWTYLHRNYSNITAPQRLAVQATLVPLKTPDVVILLTASGIKVGCRIGGVE